jgi:hypothetical protein
MLIPEFRATGIVTVFGSVQTSGFSAQNFSFQIKYTVTNPENSLLKRDYWVQVKFIRDTSALAQINSFSFYPEENPGLADELIGRIDQAAGTIIIFAPIGSGITSRTMIPHFRATGKVLVDGSTQISGTSGHLFNAPIIYEAVSANEVNRKTYTVTVRELQSTIFVSQHAFLGHGDGTSWADAFRDLKDACEAAALFPEDTPKEIWIAAGTYMPQEYFPLVANTSYIGGFAGNEAAKSQRNVAANKTFVSAFNGDTATTINGDLSFENLEFTGAGIYAELSSGHELRIANCDFSNIQASEAVYLSGGELVISSANFEDIATEDYGAVFGEDLSAVRIDNVNLRNIDAVGLYFYNCAGDIEIDNVDLQDITDNGIHITSGNGRRDFNNITGNNVGGSYGVYVDEGSGDITLSASDFDSRGIYFSSGGFPVRISGTTVKNVSTGNGVYANGGTMVIEDVAVENVTNGTGMSLAIANNSTLRVSGSTIKGVKNTSGTGLTLSGSGSAIISDTTIENIEAGSSAFNASIAGNLTIINSAINTVVANRGISLLGSGNAVITNTTINNINAGSSGYAIFVANRNLVIEDTTVDNITANYGVYGQSLSGVTISDLALCDIGHGLYFLSCNGDMEINNVNLQNISNDGIYVSSGSGKREFSAITGYDIRGNYSVYIVGSGNITLDESNFDTGGQIYLNSASINITDTETKNVRGNNAIYTYGRNIVIGGVKIENVPSGRGIYMIASGGTGQITDSSIKNCKSSGNGDGGGICISGGNNVIISGTTIENVEAGGHGGGIYADPETMTILNTVIKNAKASATSGGMCLSGSGRKIISGTTIENVETGTNGGGIFISGGISTISNTVIKNAKATYSGGGLFYSGTNTQSIIIENSRFENCRADRQNGAIFFGPEVVVLPSSYEIINTKFINCTARNGYKFMNPHDLITGTFKGCIFEDNDEIYKYSSTGSNIYAMFGIYGGYFEDCTFTNLTDTYSGEQYIFHGKSSFSPDRLWLKNADAYTTLIRCAFNFRSGSAGLCALGGYGDGYVPPNGDGHNDYLLMDGVMINNNGGQQPLLNFAKYGTFASTYDGFRFKLNNVYNGTLLNTPMAINNLVTSGVVILTNNAMPTLVP